MHVKVDQEGGRALRDRNKAKSYSRAQHHTSCGTNLMPSRGRKMVITTGTSTAQTYCHRNLRLVGKTIDELIELFCPFCHHTVPQPSLVQHRKVPGRHLKPMRLLETSAWPPHRVQVETQLIYASLSAVHATNSVQASSCTLGHHGSLYLLLSSSSIASISRN